MTNGPCGNSRDRLPPPRQLVSPRDDVKVTMSLTRRSVAFFKAQARRHRAKYQRMIRALVDAYAARYAPARRAPARRVRPRRRPRRTRPRRK